MKAHLIFEPDFFTESYIKRIADFVEDQLGVQVSYRHTGCAQRDDCINADIFIVIPGDNKKEISLKSAKGKFERNLATIVCRFHRKMMYMCNTNVDTGLELYITKVIHDAIVAKAKWPTTKKKSKPSSRQEYMNQYWYF